jgi:hypothetical protein
VPKSINIKQLQKGRRIEKEHTLTYKKIINYLLKNKKLPPYEYVFSWIAEDHLKELPDYYDRLEKMENDAKKELDEKTTKRKSHLKSTRRQAS